MRERIAIVDDDKILRGRLSAYLAGEGYRVTPLPDGAALRAHCAREPVDLVIVDLMLPGEDGLSLTRFLRETSNVGILILTGKGAPIDRVVGLEMGADDYLGKPFELRELLARIRSVLRRSNNQAKTVSPSNLVRFDGMSLDLTQRRLTGRDGAEIPLTAAEFALLSVFADNPKRPLSRDRLLDVVAGRNWQPYDRSIDLHISHLRKKLEVDAKRPALIKTVRGVGYVLASEVSRDPTRP